MSTVNRVVVFEDDPYAKDMLLKLLSRDWRTQVAGEFDSFSQKAFKSFLSQPANRIDTLIFDTEVPKNPNWPLEVVEIIRSMQKPPKLIFICTVPSPKYWNDILLGFDFYGGYVLKQEVLYSMGAIVSLVAQGKIAATRSVYHMRPHVNRNADIVIVDGSKVIYNFTRREKEIIRLGIVYNQSQRDMEDELVLSRDWISEVLSSIYKKLHLKEIISGEFPLQSFFTDEIILSRAQRVLDEYKNKDGKVNLRHAPWISTLAFHLLTIPMIEQVGK